MSPDSQHDGPLRVHVWGWYEGKVEDAEKRFWAKVLTITLPGTVVGSSEKGSYVSGGNKGGSWGNSSSSE